jgi:hypothetical protein
MADYTYGQLETLWTNAGGSKALAPLMAAIALAESSGNPGALNTTDNGGTQTSVGLWQVSNGTHSYPASWTTPAGNAAEAVAKYKSQGLGAWGTYTSGAYYQYYQGDTPASALPQGGGSSGAGTQQAQTDSAIVPGWLSGAADIAEGPFGILNAVGSEIVSTVAGGGKGIAGTAESLEGIWKSFDTIAKEGEALLTGIEWLFVPTHWVRIAAFVFGAGTAVPGLYYLSKAGQGDMSLALGILLTVISGVLFFIAFHNLPEDIGSLSDLLQWLSDSIQSGHAAPENAPGTGAVLA